MRDLLFPLLKNSKSGVDDRGHRFRSGSLLTNYPHTLVGIMEMILNLDELDNSDNLEDGILSNILFTHHVVDDEDFTSFKPCTPQYKKLKNREFTSLTLRVTDQAGNIITDGLQVTAGIHIRDRK